MIDNPFIDALAATFYRAGEAILGHYKNAEVSRKSDGSPVTDADLESNDILVEFLSTTELPVMSEESKRNPYSVRKGWESFWCVDPLDGTKEFIRGNDEFVINVALVKNRRPIFGAIYHPTSRRMWYNLGDEVYRCNVAHLGIEEQEKLNALPYAQIEPVVLSSHSYVNQAFTNYFNELKARDSQLRAKPMGSALKFCELLDGKAIEYPRFAPTMEWDTAAGHALVELHGFEVVSQITGKPLEYNKENLKNDFFIAKRTENE